MVQALITLSNGDLVSGSRDGTIKIWNTKDWKLKRTLAGYTHGVNALTQLANGDLAASGTLDKTIKIWNSQNGTLMRTLSGHNNMVRTLATLPNGDLVSGSGEELIVWNPKDGAIKQKLNDGTIYAEKLITLPNGDIVTGSDTIQILSTGYMQKFLVDSFVIQ